MERSSRFLLAYCDADPSVTCYKNKRKKGWDLFLLFVGWILSCGRIALKNGGRM